MRNEEINIKTERKVAKPECKQLAKKHRNLKVNNI